MLWLVDCSRRSGRAEKFSPELQATAPGNSSSVLSWRAVSHGGFPRPLQPPWFQWGRADVSPWLCWRLATSPACTIHGNSSCSAGPGNTGNALLEGAGKSRGSQGGSLHSSLVSVPRRWHCHGQVTCSSMLSQSNSPAHPARGTRKLCPAVTELQKVFDPIGTIGQGSLWALDSKPGLRLQRKREQGVNVNQGGAAALQSQQWWEVEGPCAPSAPGGVKHLYIEQEQRQHPLRCCPGGLGGVLGSSPARTACPRYRVGAHPWPGAGRHEHTHAACRVCPAPLHPCPAAKGPPLWPIWLYCSLGPAGQAPCARLHVGAGAPRSWAGQLLDITCLSKR
ncbi:uncharacterized protein LOC127482344 [Manacus candei]|uniref:uncharacterized protein LOC127482344 n=1 Tax=Manacus candei TaxID=415023 RepID=UPI002226A3A0|nr:uncharacterized protein LOC127482344 [Manacus candei]